jgi:lipopolysaccharide biosynthesis protein
MGLTGIGRFATRLRDYLKHVGEKIATVTLGALFISPLGQNLRSTMGRVGPPRPVPSIQIAIIAHVYYPELLPEILACRATIPGSVDLHVTTTDDRAQSVRSALRGQKAVEVHVLPNRGRDIAPFLAILGTGALDSYDAVLKLHTKSSPHLLDGALRRRLLFQTLCGARQSVLRILFLFLDPTTAMVGWGSCFRSTPRFWFANEMRVRELAIRMGAAESVRPGFFEGSMFWFRPSAFKRLRALNLTAEDFETEAGQVDGTLHHAIERCFTIAVWASGYVVRDLHGRLLPRD